MGNPYSVPFHNGWNIHESVPGRLLAHLKGVGRVPWLNLDLVLLSLTMLFTVVIEARAAGPLSLSKLLDLRVSMGNFVLAIVCILFWRTAIVVLTVRTTGSPTLAQPILQVLARVTACTGMAGLMFLLRHPGRSVFGPSLMFWALAFFLLMLSRFTSAIFHTFVWPSLGRERRVIIVGSGWRAQKLARELRAKTRSRYRIMGFVDSDSQLASTSLLGATEDLESLLVTQVVDKVFIALPIKSQYDQIQTAIRACERVGVQSGYSTDLFSTQVAKRRSIEEAEFPCVLLHMVHDDQHRIVKRVFDVVGALFGIVFLSPLFLAVALVIKLTSKGPIIFRQQRYGLNRRLFPMFKFRSMVADAEVRQGDLEHLNETSGPVFKIRRDPRITPIGRLIRKTSIDELPQLVNVLLGHMSLVGPRPLPTRDVSRFSEASLMRRFSVKPGLTGLWQVSGRSDTSFGRWIELDLEYIDRWTFLLDIEILLRTIPAVLRGDGAA